MIVEGVKNDRFDHPLLSIDLCNVGTVLNVMKVGKPQAWRLDLRV